MQYHIITSGSYQQFMNYEGFIVGLRNLAGTQGPDFLVRMTGLTATAFLQLQRSDLWCKGASADGKIITPLPHENYPAADQNPKLDFELNSKSLEAGVAALAAWAPKGSGIALPSSVYATIVATSEAGRFDIAAYAGEMMSAQSGSVPSGSFKTLLPILRSWGALRKAQPGAPSFGIPVRNTMEYVEGRVDLNGEALSKWQREVEVAGGGHPDNPAIPDHFDPPGRDGEGTGPVER